MAANSFSKRDFDVFEARLKQIFPQEGGHLLFGKDQIQAQADIEASIRKRNKEMREKEVLTDFFIPLKDCNSGETNDWFAVDPSIQEGIAEGTDRLLRTMFSSYQEVIIGENYLMVPEWRKIHVRNKNWDRRSPDITAYHTLCTTTIRDDHHVYKELPKRHYENLRPELKRLRLQTSKCIVFGMEVFQDADDVRFGKFVEELISNLSSESPTKARPTVSVHLPRDIDTPQMLDLLERSIGIEKYGKMETIEVIQAIDSQSIVVSSGSFLPVRQIIADLYLSGVKPMAVLCSAIDIEATEYPLHKNDEEIMDPISPRVQEFAKAYECIQITTAQPPCGVPNLNLYVRKDCLPPPQESDVPSDKAQGFKKPNLPKQGGSGSSRAQRGGQGQQAGPSRS